MLQNDLKDVLNLIERRRKIAAVGARAIALVVLISWLVFVAIDVKRDPEFAAAIACFACGFGSQVLKILGCSTADLITVREFFIASLGTSQATIDGSKFSSAVVGAKFRGYATFKMTLIATESKKFFCVAVAVLLMCGFALFVPPLILAYFAGVRLFGHKQAEKIERDLLNSSNSHPAVVAIIKIETFDEFVTVAREIGRTSAKVEAA